MRAWIGRELSVGVCWCECEGVRIGKKWNGVCDFFSFSVSLGSTEKAGVGVEKSEPTVVGVVRPLLEGKPSERDSIKASFDNG